MKKTEKNKTMPLCGNDMSLVGFIHDGVGNIIGVLEDVLLQRRKTRLAHLALETMVHSIENVVDSDSGLVSGLSAVLVDTSLDKDAVPVVVGSLVDGVGATNVTLRCVTDEIDGGRGSNETVLGVAPLAHEAGSELKGGHLGLAKGVGV